MTKTPIGIFIIIGSLLNTWRKCPNLTFMDLLEEVTDYGMPEISDDELAYKIQIYKDLYLKDK